MLGLVVDDVVEASASIINVSHVNTMKLEQILETEKKRESEILIMKLNNKTLEISRRTCEEL